MRSKAILFLGSLVVLTACASGRSDSGMGKSKVDIIKPEIRIRQVSDISAAARYIQGALPVKYELSVSNRSGIPITLTSVSVQSLGMGAYTLNPSSRPFKMQVAPDQFDKVEFWVPAVIEDVTVFGANGPVTLRCIAQFDSPDGQFQEIVVQEVHAMTGRDTAAQ